MSVTARTEVRDGMHIDWDVDIPMRDGLVLKADVFRPLKKGRFPIIMSYGPYGKGLAFQEGYKTAWDRMADHHPDVTINYRRVTVSFTTHSEGGITAKDVEGAREVQEG